MKKSRINKNGEEESNQINEARNSSDSQALGEDFSANKRNCQTDASSNNIGDDNRTFGEDDSNEFTGLIKEFITEKNICRVTFRLPSQAAPDACSVHLVGDFNNWDVYATPLKCLSNGNYTVTLDLECGREYQYRFLIDETKWENDWKADKYVPSPYGHCDNSVLIL